IASSGVMFTADPETGFRNAVVLQAAWGLGESIVQGKVIPDEFVLFKPFLGMKTSPILSKTLGRKTCKAAYGKGGVATIPLGQTLQKQFCLADEEAKTLAVWGVALENHFSKAYGKECSLDIEWAKDGKTSQLFIVQVRPETVHSYSDKRMHEEYILKAKSRVLATGVAVGTRIGTGKVRIAKRLEDGKNIKKGEILVTHNTDPDWEPVLRRVSAVVTESGGRTSHAAIIAREFGIPTVVGAEFAAKDLHNGQSITIDCSSGEKGILYEGILPFTVQKHPMLDVPQTRTKIMLNIGSPSEGFRYAYLPVGGVGLGRLEFIISSSIGIHPNVLLDYAKLKRQGVKSGYLKNTLKMIDERTGGYKNKEEFYVDTLAKGIAKIAAAFWPKDVIIRFSDFKTNEYRSLIGGELYEPKEENPMLGWRGASRYYHPNFKAAFGMECRALEKARKDYGFSNIIPMIPFCRTIDEAKRVVAGMEEYGLDRKDNTALKIYVMCEIPSNVLLADQFLDIFDGMSIGSNDLTQLTLGLDRDSGGSVKIGNENNEAVKKMIEIAIKACKARGKYIGVCGQGPSDYPEFAEFLVEKGIDSISLNADAVFSMIGRIAALEEKRNISQRVASH
ncbi:MAG: phosphoenolpyruvate synthase, partial [Candidatus Wildermuthbacteria bacterium]|nr:phosphoenolpyruvate synthase [Candidatus Wildermuthbacteria bacterium]